MRRSSGEFWIYAILGHGMLWERGKESKKVLYARPPALPPSPCNLYPESPWQSPCHCRFLCPVLLGRSLVLHTDSFGFRMPHCHTYTVQHMLNPRACTNTHTHAICAQMLMCAQSHTAHLCFGSIGHRSLGISRAAASMLFQIVQGVGGSEVREQVF
jgi:hypothetical protein